MATSGTYAFSPTLVDIVADAYDRLEIRLPAITTDHLISARRSLNYVMVVLDNLGINLWAVDLQTVPLLPTVPTYDCPTSTVCVLDVYRHSVADGIDILLSPLSRTDYASIPNKTLAGTPISYWNNRQTPTQTMTVWQPVTDAGLYELRYYRMRQLQDANPQNTQTPDIPLRFQECLAAGLAAHLAIKWKPEKFAILQGYAKEVWAQAAQEDRERVSLFLVPQFTSYFQ